jgi:hypothetical protein
MAGIGDITKFPNSKMAAAAQLGQSRFVSGDATNVLVSGGGGTTPLDGFSPTGAWSFSRKLLTAYAGGFYSATASAVNTLNDQSGGGHNLFDGGNSSHSPTATTAGPNSRACATWNGAGNYLQTIGNLLSSFISGSSGFVVISALPTAIVNTAGNPWGGDPLWNDDGFQNTGMYLKNISGGVGYSYNWDTAARVTPNSAVVTLGVPHVFVWRHDSGVLYFSMDGGAETSIAAGTNTAVPSTGFYLGGDGAVTFTGKIFEVATWTTVPNAIDRATIIASFKSWCGA